MTTPAQNYYDNSVIYNETYILLHNGWVGPYVASGIGLRERLVRPASVTSPRREDGTRAPTNWNRRGGVSYPPLIEYRWSEQPQGGIGDHITYVSEWPPYVPDVPDYMIFSSDLKARADQKCLERLKDSKVNLGVALAEARRTAGLLAQTANSISKMVDTFRSKNKRKIWEAVKKGGKNTPQSWLELQYGWTPLLSDVLGSAEAMAEAVSLGRRFNITVRGSAKLVEPWEVEVLQPGMLGYNYRGSTTERCEVIATYQLPANLLPSLSSLGLTNPLEIAWELVPYSFVIDWLLPIGDWLHVLDAGAFLQFKEGSTSHMLRKTAFGRAFVDPDGHPYRHNQTVRTIAPGKLQWYNFQRNVNTSPPAVHLPSLKNPLSLGHVANAMSLLASSFSRRGRRDRGSIGNANLTGHGQGYTD